MKQQTTETVRIRAADAAYIRKIMAKRLAKSVPGVSVASVVADLILSAERKIAAPKEW